MMQGFHPFRVNDTVFQKTVAINDYYLRGPDGDYPLGQIQSQGRTHAVMAQTVVPWIPLWAYQAWVSRGVDWLVMSEDLPDPDNRVTVEQDGRIRLHYRPNNLRAHRQLVKEMRRLLRRARLLAVVKHSHGARNTTHQCGTMVFGHDPRSSVLDPYLPHARRPQSLRRGRVVLPFVCRRQSGADDRRAGAARRRPYCGTRSSRVDRRSDGRQ